MLLTLIVAAVGLGAYRYLSRGLPTDQQILSYHSPRTTRVFARDGRLVATLFEQNRDPAKLQQISKSMQNAVIAIEDSRFRKHHGIDWRGVARAALANLAAGRLQQGAGTITMQLARNRFLTNEKSFSRKFKESILALRMEKLFSKDEILELYLNQIYFGGGAYGVNAAAKHYFQKKASALTVAESAMLAGLIQAPSHLNPYRHPQEARRRQKQVLKRMEEQHFLDGKHYQEAVQQAEAMKFVNEPETASNSGMLKCPYFTTFAIHEASAVVPQSDIYRQGLSIYTTLDFDLQRQAESVVKRAIAEGGAGYGVDNAALVVIENETGAIRAMVGGTGWNLKNQFNRAYQAARQPGSAFKPFVYAEALRMGYSPRSLIEDKPYTGENGWQPQNYDHRYLGTMTLADALRLSRNVVAVKLIEQVGPERVARLAGRMGLPGKLPAYPSLALGSAEVTPLEMATAYAAFAREGETVASFAVKGIYYPSGERVIPERLQPSRVLDQSTARQMISMMKGVVLSGTGTAAAVPGLDIGGKTGTTDAYRDAWFVGFTPRYTMAVWVGNDDHSPTYGVAGGSLPAQIFRQLIVAAVGDQQPLAFNAPDPDQTFTYRPRSYTSKPSDGSIAVYTYDDAGSEVTYITNRVDDYHYETADYSYQPTPPTGAGEWRYFEY